MIAPVMFAPTLRSSDSAAVTSASVVSDADTTNITTSSIDAMPRTSATASTGGVSTTV